MNVKITYFFEAVQPAGKYASAALGWSETVYGFSTTIATVDAWLSAPDVLNYVLLRRPTLDSPYRIAWIRVSDEANPRNFKLLALDSAYGTAIPAVSNSPGKAGFTFGQVQCSLLVDLARLPDGGTDFTHHRKFLMRAMPLSVINGNILNYTDPNFNAIQVFLTWLANHETGSSVVVKLPPGVVPISTLGIRYVRSDLTPYLPLPAVTAVAGDPNSISVAGSIGAVNNRIQMRRVPDASRDLNKTWTVTALFAGPPATTILGTTKRSLMAASYTPPGRAQYRVFVPLYNLFSQYTIIGLRTKKTGKLFRQLRGKRSPR